VYGAAKGGYLGVMRWVREYGCEWNAMTGYEGRILTLSPKP
jgi:hypothetical protein